MALRWKQAPPRSTWGEFGPDDQLGRMNLVTPAKVLQGLAEVHEGRTFCLSLPLDVPGGNAMNPRRQPPQRFAVLRDGKSAGQQGFCWAYASEDPDLTDVVNDDVVLMSLQYSTQTPTRLRTSRATPARVPGRSASSTWRRTACRGAG